MSDEDEKKWAAIAGFQSMRREADAPILAAYERGLRRGLAIAGEHMSEYEYQVFTIDYEAATEQMEREIEEAKR